MGICPPGCCLPKYNTLGRGDVNTDPGQLRPVTPPDVTGARHHVLYQRSSSNGSDEERSYGTPSRTRSPQAALRQVPPRKSARLRSISPGPIVPEIVQREESSDEELDAVDVASSDESDYEDEMQAGPLPADLVTVPDPSDPIPISKCRLHCFSIVNQQYKHFRKPFGQKSLAAHRTFIESLRAFGFQIAEFENLDDTAVNGSYEEYSLRLCEIMESKQEDEEALLVFVFLGHARVEYDDVYFYSVDAVDEDDDPTLALSTIEDYLPTICEGLRLLCIVDGKRNQIAEDDLSDEILKLPNSALSFPRGRFDHMNTRFLRVLNQEFRRDTVDFMDLFASLQSGADGRAYVVSRWEKNLIIRKE